MFALFSQMNTSFSKEHCDRVSVINRNAFVTHHVEFEVWCHVFLVPFFAMYNVTFCYFCLQKRRSLLRCSCQLITFCLAFHLIPHLELPLSQQPYPFLHIILSWSYPKTGYVVVVTISSLYINKVGILVNSSLEEVGPVSWPGHKGIMGIPAATCIRASTSSLK